jgi:hypothetical protein
VPQISILVFPQVGYQVSQVAGAVPHCLGRFRVHLRYCVITVHLGNQVTQFDQHLNLYRCALAGLLPPFVK